MKLAFLYAGQGAQHVGMGQDLYAQYPAFRQVLDNAPVDFDLKKLSFEGPEEQLNDTRYTQPCMVAFAAGVTAILKDAGITKHISYHCSRHSFACLQLDAGTSIAVVQRYLGHKNVATTEVYAKISDAQKRASVGCITLKK